MGSFLSADPFIQFPDNLQSYNRYSYVLNNPGSFTDPSGHFILELVGAVVGGIISLAFDPSIVAVLLGGFVAYQAVQAYKQGGVKGLLQFGFMTAVSIGFATAIGGIFAIDAVGQFFGSFIEVARAAAHGISSGLLQDLGGGNFAAGFASGFVGGLGGTLYQGSDLFTGMMIAGVVGGLASEIAGGDFMMGALSGAIIYAFNHRDVAGTHSDADNAEGRDEPALPQVQNRGGDVEALQADLTNLPPEVLAELQAKGVTFVAVKDSVVEHLPHLKGVRPRGWPKGKTWDVIPGAYDPKTNTVVVATSGKYGHGSFNLALHETGHAYDAIIGRASHSSAFKSAWRADRGTLGSYYTQPGVVGLQETFAEGFARYYGGDGSYAENHPNLNTYWKNRK